MRQKGFAPVIILVLVVLVVVGYFGYKNFQPKLQTVFSPEASATTDPTANWKTYTNSQYGLSFKSSNQPEEIIGDGSKDGSVTVANKTYPAKQLTTGALGAPSVRIIYGWTDTTSDPYSPSITLTKRVINGIAWHLSYTENIVNEPGCYSARSQALMPNQTDTIELYVIEQCPSDPKLEKSLNELVQILSTFKFTE